MMAGLKTISTIPSVSIQDMSDSLKNEQWRYQNAMVLFHLKNKSTNNRYKVTSTTVLCYQVSTAVPGKHIVDLVKELKMDLMVPITTKIDKLSTPLNFRSINLQPATDKVIETIVRHQLRQQDVRLQNEEDE